MRCAEIPATIWYDRKEKCWWGWSSRKPWRRPCKVWGETAWVYHSDPLFEEWQVKCSRCPHDFGHLCRVETDRERAKKAVAAHFKRVLAPYMQKQMEKQKRAIDAMLEMTKGIDYHGAACTCERCSTPLPLPAAMYPCTDERSSGWHRLRTPTATAHLPQPADVIVLTVEVSDKVVDEITDSLEPSKGTSNGTP